ncbi:hypothetical protein N7G274_002956 [Stereocaulon virgatum]|uniref:Uncharacterized protein n=1 Tax=Stereocaulon virgatum TaxID=373712 RepID=A0ABR4AHE7_9LECA
MYDPCAQWSSGMSAFSRIGRATLQLFRLSVYKSCVNLPIPSCIARFPVLGTLSASSRSDCKDRWGMQQIMSNLDNGDLERVLCGSRSLARLHKRQSKPGINVMMLVSMLVVGAAWRMNDVDQSIAECISTSW